MWLGTGGWLQCDPLGATIRSHPLQARPVAASDAADVFARLIVPAYWQFNLSSHDMPTFAAHEIWLQAKLAEPTCCC